VQRFGRREELTVEPGLEAKLSIIDMRWVRATGYRIDSRLHKRRTAFCRARRRDASSGANRPVRLSARLGIKFHIVSVASITAWCAGSLDHVVDKSKESSGNRESEALCSLEVEHEFEVC